MARWLGTFTGLDRWTARRWAAALMLACGCASDGGDGAPGQESGGASVDDDGGDPQGSGGFDDGAGDGGTGGAGADEGDGQPPDDMNPGGSTGDSTTGEPACNDVDAVTLFLSPDDSNSMSSPVQARASVLGSFGSLTYVALRTWEFLNYYTFAYPAAEPGSVVVTPSLLVEEGAAPGDYVLQIGVSSEHIDEAERAPLNLTFVLDTSGSMSGQPIDLSREVCRTIASQLREGDVVSMVTWNTENAVVLSGHAVSGPDDPDLVAAIDGMEAGGGTDLHAGLVAGYELASAAHEPGVLSRVILISDGGANTGVTDIDVIAGNAGANDEDGIYMVGVGVGDPNTYNDALMDDVTDAGKGASVFVAEPADAVRVFDDAFLSTLAVAARDVQVQLDLPPGFEIVRFSGEEYSSDPAEVEPQHLAPNDAMVFHQQIHTCAPELVADDTEITVTARFKDAITFEQREVSRTATFAELLAGDPALARKGAAVFAYAEALKVARDGTPEDRAAAVTGALASVALAEAALPDDADLAEIRRVLEAL